jgi:hypothetical protein
MCGEYGAAASELLTTLQINRVKYAINIVTGITAYSAYSASRANMSPLCFERAAGPVAFNWIIFNKQNT